MKLFMVEYTWDDMPHGDIIPLADDRHETAIAWLHENVAQDLDEAEEDRSEFTIDSINPVDDMIDAQGNGELTGATVEQCEDMLTTVLMAYHRARKLSGDAKGYAMATLYEIQTVAGDL